MTPPRLADQFLKFFCAPDRLEEVQGDLHEEFAYQVRRVGERRARWRYWRDVLGFFRPFAIRRKPGDYSPNPLFSPSMIQNYVKIAWRNLVKNQTYALINVTGLGLGIGAALLIFALVRYHYAIDKHHQKYDRIYRVLTEFVTPEGVFDIAGVPYAMGKALQNDHPAIENLAMIDIYRDPLVAIPMPTGPDRKFKEAHQMGAFVQPAYFRIFDYHWVVGGPTELAQPNTVVISAENATKYFGTTQVIGKVIKLNAVMNTRIVGVFEDYRDNTDFAYPIMASWASLREFYGRPLTEGFDNINGDTQCFVSLNDGFSKADWDRQMMAFVKKYKPHGVKDTRFPMQPLRDIHFSTDTGGVSQGLIWSLFAIGVFLIITASINFVNLATAQALNRSREVGVRKVLGSTRGQLFWQFIGETALLTLAATALALLFFQIGQQLAQERLHGAFRFTFYYDVSVIGWLALIVVVVIGLSGLYPALVLAGFKPAMALAGRITTRQVGGFSVRRGLVITQFAISQMLIVGMIVVASQLQYIQTKDLGFRQEAILTVRLPSSPKQDISKMNTFRNLALAIPEVKKLSYSVSGPPQSGWISQTMIKFDTRPEPEKFTTQQQFIDADYLNVYGLKLVAGRNLQPADTAREVLVNEAFVKALGIRDPAKVLGKLMHNGRGLEIVGVLKDFNQNNLKSGIAPLYMTTRATSYFYANLQLHNGNFRRVIEQLEKDYNGLYPDSYFSAQFVDEQLQEFYVQEQTMASLVNFFAGIAVIIGGLGLYGLVLFMAAQKTKEIGVRKVLGASIRDILWLFGREFFRLIVVAFVIATPMAWWVMSHWLQDFVYRIELDWWIFALAMLLTALITLLTVSYESIKASFANPVKSLRSE
ncbi:putative permease [Larkinella arboricola]|uniref:Putative permease n=1 Tax=Larkinella arboricola TaxID=643671 RepID=A0A327X9Q5_LARAB|nr:permease prefix domain 2-containing transporter [Larkinella arboricola]RAK02834.1 putative permease [Larkinella arboricola]